MTLCKCGCGRHVKPGNTWINGHNKHPLTEDGRRKISDRMIGNKYGCGKQSKETCEKKSKSFTGRIYSIDHNKNMTKSIKLQWKLHPEVHDAGIEKQRGGNDIVRHHYIYDESDLSKYTIPMTRAKYAQIHHAMKKEGIIVPHINIKDVL